jgi:hypothetical protein
MRTLTAVTVVAAVGLGAGLEMEARVHLDRPGRLPLALLFPVLPVLFWGTIGFVAVMIAAAVMQALAQRNQAPGSETAAMPTGEAESGFLIGSSRLTLPAVYLTHLTAGIPRIIMAAAASRSSGPTAENPGSEALSQMSQLISSRLVTEAKERSCHAR